jgi:hypothetical protein
MQLFRCGRCSHNRLNTVARTQEVDVTTQLMLGVRLLQAQAHKCVQMFMFLFSSVSYIYILLGLERMLTSATPVSLQNPCTISANFLPSLLSLFTLGCVSLLLFGLCIIFFILLFCLAGSLQWWKSQGLLQEN